jgi:hypothetical protein
LGETQTSTQPRIAWDVEVIKEPTCETEGTERRTCPDDSSPPRTITVPILPWSEWTIQYEPTCESVGLEKRYCPDGTSEIHLIGKLTNCR